MIIVIIKINITDLIFNPAEGVVGWTSLVEDTEGDVEDSAVDVEDTGVVVEDPVVVSVDEPGVVVLDTIVVVVGSCHVNLTRPHIIRKPAFLF